MGNVGKDSYSMKSLSEVANKKFQNIYGSPNANLPRVSIKYMISKMHLHGLHLFL